MKNEGQGNSKSILELINNKFESIGPMLKPFILEISERAKDHSEYESLLVDCMNTYLGLREPFMVPLVQSLMAQVKATDLIPKAIYDTN